MALIPKRPGQLFPWAANLVGTPQAATPCSPLSVGPMTQAPREAPERGLMSGDSRMVMPARAPLQAAIGYSKGRELVLTAIPIRVTATGAQELRLAQDVQDLDEFDLELRVLRLEGTGPSVVVEVQTGMQTESSEGWVSVASFTSVASAPSTVKRNFVNLLRFIRWNVVTLGGTGTPAATCYISGVGRRWA